jgi:hypothetical protein
MQHLLMMMACLFLRLSKVRIFPKAAVHVKKAALEGVSVLQGKSLPSTLTKVQEKAFALKVPCLEGIHHNLSPHPFLTVTEFKRLKSDAKSEPSSHVPLY